jgi:transposase
LDAAHFVHGAFLGHLWSPERLYVPSPSGRSRFNVLGALNAITKEVVSVENTDYINSLSVCEMLLKLKHRSIGVDITIILDNARYQTCQCVTDFAAELGIELLFLPPYSPNLNLIERLWKFVKKRCLNSKYYSTFLEFCTAIQRAIEPTEENLLELESLLSLKFQSFSKVKVSTV